MRRRGVDEALEVEADDREPIWYSYQVGEKPELQMNSRKKRRSKMNAQSEGHLAGVHKDRRLGSGNLDHGDDLKKNAVIRQRIAESGETYPIR